MNGSEKKFRKYGNRKIYDFETRSYAKLDKIYKVYKEGFLVTVFDSIGNDITKNVLTQAVYQAHQQDETFQDLVLKYAQDQNIRC